MDYLKLEKDGAVFIVTMTNGEKANTLTDDVLSEWHQILDEIEHSSDNGALVVKSDVEKFWSTGINLKWLTAKGMEYLPTFGKKLDVFFERLTRLNIPTIGALSGHTYGGGALMASALDFRLMAKGPGRFCFPEVDVKIPFSPLMMQLIQATFDRSTLKTLALTAKAVDAETAYGLGVVDEVVSQDALNEKAMALAVQLAEKDRKTYTTVKRSLRPVSLETV